jgi:hypothetical protein
LQELHSGHQLLQLLLVQLPLARLHLLHLLQQLHRLGSNWGSSAEADGTPAAVGGLQEATMLQLCLSRQSCQDPICSGARHSACAQLLLLLLLSVHVMLARQQTQPRQCSSKFLVQDICHGPECVLHSQGVKLVYHLCTCSSTTYNRCITGAGTTGC